MEFGPSSDEPPLIRFPDDVRTLPLHPDTDRSPLEYLPERRGVVRFELAKTLKMNGAIEGFTTEELERIRGVTDVHELDVDPKPCISREEFLAYAEERCTLENEGEALVVSYDGAVYSPSFSQPLGAGKALYRDHHHPEDLPGTRSACRQLLQDVKDGTLIPREKMHLAHRITQRVRDCDQDIAASHYIVKNWRTLTVDPDAMRRMERLIELEDKLDIHAGLVPVHFENEQEKELFEIQTWIFEPYSAWCKNGKKAEDIRSTLLTMDERIDRYMRGEAERKEADWHCEKIEAGIGWIMIEGKGSGAQARHKLCEHYRVVTLATQDGERWRYSIGQVAEEFLPSRKMPLQLDLPALCDYLNGVEALRGNTRDKWGGRTNVIGSPQESLSMISPQEMTEIIKRFLHPERPPTKGKARMHLGMTRGNIQRTLAGMMVA